MQTADVELDESLYRIASTEWCSAGKCGWIATYLEVLAERPKHRAFACLEALMMNPVTAAIGDVSRSYHGLLNLFMLEGRPSVAVRGPDGFPSRGPLATEHARLGAFLRASDPANWHNSPSLPGIEDPLALLRAAVLEQSKDELHRWTRALEERIAWLKRNRGRFSADTLLFWRVELRKLRAEAQNSCFEKSVR